MSRQTRKTDPDKALAKTHGTERGGLASLGAMVDAYASGKGGSPSNRASTYAHTEKHTAGKGGNNISQGEQHADDQWGIGRRNADSFRSQMRDYDKERRRPKLKWEGIDHFSGQTITSPSSGKKKERWF